MARNQAPADDRIRCERDARSSSRSPGDASGRELARTELHGPEPYTLTAELLVWAADEIATNGTATTGASGSVTAFGLRRLTGASEGIGLREPSRTSDARDHKRRESRQRG